MPNNPVFVRRGPGKLRLAPLGTPVPATLVAAWDVAWVEMGYTRDGTVITFDQTFEDVNVAEEFDPIGVDQTARNIRIAVAAAEMMAVNLQRAFNGGTITPSGAPPNEIDLYRPPAPGVYTELMLAWESTDVFERLIFRRAIQAGSVEVSRQKAPTMAAIPMEFRALKPSAGDIFDWILKRTMTAA